MRFIPKSEAEVSAGNLLPNGLYDFEILEAEETVSKAGNDMIKLEVRVYDNDGGGRNVFDYLVGTDKAAYKVRHCAAAVGMLTNYEQGELRAQALVGRTGRCKIVLKKGTGEYADQNQIADYIPDESKATSNGSARVPGKAPVDLDDDIPF